MRFPVARSGVDRVVIVVRRTATTAPVAPFLRRNHPGCWPFAISRSLVGARWPVTVAAAIVRSVPITVPVAVSTVSRVAVIMGVSMPRRLGVVPGIVVGIIIVLVTVRVRVARPIACIAKARIEIGPEIDSRVRGAGKPA